jgi:hypothetical protein
VEFFRNWQLLNFCLDCKAESSIEIFLFLQEFVECQNVLDEILLCFLKASDEIFVQCWLWQNEPWIHECVDHFFYDFLSCEDSFIFDFLGLLGFLLALDFIFGMRSLFIFEKQLWDICYHSLKLLVSFSVVSNCWRDFIMSFLIYIKNDIVVGWGIGFLLVVIFWWVW